jgi:hypothetical protein
MFSQEVSSDFMIKYTYHPSLPVLNWKLDVHFALSSFGVVSHTRWSHLIFLEINRYPLSNPKVVQVVFNSFMSLILVKLFTFCIKISTLRTIFF